MSSLPSSWRDSSSLAPRPRSLSTAGPAPEPAKFLWLKADDDGTWWPAMVLDEPPLELVEFLGEALDCCVRLFHVPDGADVIPIDSRDTERVGILRWDRKEVDPRFRAANVAPAVQRAEAAWRSSHHGTRTLRSGAPQRVSPQPAALAAAELDGEELFEDIPYSEEEVIKMSQLLDALDGSTAAAIRQQLQASLRVPKPGPSRHQPPLSSHPASAARRASSGTTTSNRSGTAATAVNDRKPVSGNPTSPTAPTGIERQQNPGVHAAPADHPLATRSSAEPSSVPVLPAAAEASTNSSSQCNDLVRIRSVTIAEEPIFEPAAIDVLRLEVFENSEKVVLDPIYRYVETLGAVSVSSRSIECVLPTRKFLYQNAHRARDRVLLCALGPNYEHTQGWFEPLSLGGGDDPIQVTITVNGTAVAIPKNWRIPTGRVSTARRTLIPIDITDVVECTLPDEEGFALQVVFSDIVPQMVLWEAILVEVLVEELEVTAVCDAIRGQYTSSRPAANAAAARRARTTTAEPPSDGLEVARQEISACCPLTSVQLQTPCRSVACEHLQCLELTSVVSHCIRTHTWNCPLCHASALPKELAVDYPLMELLSRATRDDLAGCTIAVDPRSAQSAGGGYTLLRKKRRREPQTPALSVDDDEE